MTRKALEAIFGWSAPFAVLLSIAILTLTQGGPVIGALQGLDSRAALVSAYFSIFAIGASLSLASMAVAVHARLPRMRKQCAVPLIGLGDAAEDIDARTVLVKAYAAGVMVLFIGFPAFVLGHVNSKVAKYAYVWNEKMPAGASMPARCALPPMWPFGACDADGTTLAQFLQYTTNEEVSHARLWLSGRRCDFVFSREMTGPQVKARLDANPPAPALTDEEIAARKRLGDLQVVRLIYTSGDESSGSCADSRELSPVCRADKEECRGVEWRPIASPALVVGFTLLAAASVVWSVAAVVRGPERWN